MLTYTRVLARRSASKAAPQRRTPRRTEQWFVITRTIDAPRETVFQAWTDAGYVAKWWGPRGVSDAVCEVSPRPGGAVRLHMCTPGGTLLPVRGVFHEIVAPARIVLTASAFENARRRPRVKAKHTVTFAEQDGKTCIRLRVVVVQSMPGIPGARSALEQAWRESLDRLDEELARARPTAPPGS